MATERAEMKTHPGMGSRPADETNIGGTERVGSFVSGGLLALYGLRRGLSGLPLAAAGAALMYRGATGHSRIYDRLQINTARPEESKIQMATAITVNRPIDDVYAFWRQSENWPRFMHHLRSVERLSDTRYRWVAEPAIGSTPVEWESEIVEERPNELIRWETVPGSELYNAGSVTFVAAPAGRGTEVHVSMAYRPASTAGLVLSRLANPLNAQILKEEIRRFKSVMEAGEVPTTKGQPSA